MLRIHFKIFVSSGKLDHEQFALAMWLVKQTLSGVEPPKKLTPDMVPPSVRDVKLLVGKDLLKAHSFLTMIASGYICKVNGFWRSTTLVVFKKVLRRNKPKLRRIDSL